MQEMKDCSATLSGLMPIAFHASLSFNMTQTISATKLACTISWEHFMDNFMRILSEFVQEDEKHDESFWKSVTEVERQRIVDEIIARLNHGLVQEAFR